MSQNIVEELNIFSKKFKVNQELYSKKTKEFMGDEENSNNDDENNFRTNRRDSVTDNFLMAEEENNELQNRDRELNNILRGVNTLTEMFKDFQVVVSEQGSILDRIDYNIEVSADNVLKGKKKIIKANESQQRSCFRNLILILLTVIFVESLLLIFKFL